MQEKQKKETSIPSRLRGRGVEVSKTLFYSEKILTFSEMRANMSIEKATTDRRLARILYVSKVTA